jgi:S-DNA-T family DNA segregation ATPase FtsK/SpoIIIE
MASKKANKAKTRKKKSASFKSPFTFLKSDGFLKTIGLFIVLFSILLLIAEISYLFSWKTDSTHLYHDSPKNLIGWTGRYLSQFFIENTFGLSSLLFSAIFFVYGFRILFKHSIVPLVKFTIHAVIIMFLLSFISAIILLPSGNYINLAGNIGLQSYLTSQFYLGKIGSILLIFFLVVLYLSLIFNFSFSLPQKKTQKKADKKTSSNFDSGKYNTAEFAVDEDKQESANEIELELEETPETENSDENNHSDEDSRDNDFEEVKPHLQENPIQEEIELTIEAPKEEKLLTDNKVEDIKEGAHTGLDKEYDPRLDLPHYQYPTIDLLEAYDKNNAAVEKEELEQNKQKIVDTLNNYKIDIVKIKATIGPTVTLYEIIPAPGIRISKIKNLEDDIALSLAALGIRIIAPIPGRGTIGIEVPNRNPQIVSMRSILASEKFQNSKFELPIGLGKTISNESFVADLAKMPHILMAGATGQGKSVGLNAVLASLLYKKHPTELKFILVDPKKVELSLFTKIERHFLAKLPDSEEAIITDTRKVVKTLNSLTIEMDNRYELLKDAQVRNIKEYNAKFISRKLNPLQGHRFLPYFVLVVDEFADLMMTAGKEVEAPITRLAQLARAVGIHLIIATQRPSVNIITGSIKANFPARIAFRVISKIDSRTILDSGGADQLVGKGDMLLSTGNDMVRLQCAFIDTPEVDKITDFIGSQRAFPHAYYLPEVEDDEDANNFDIDSNDWDDMFEEAAQIIVQTQQGSTSLLQRKLKLGYNRAGRIIDQLEAAGIVGPFKGSKAREVLIKDELSLEQFLKDLLKKS